MVENRIDPLDIMLSGWSFMQTKILLAAIEIDVFTALVDDPKSEAELRAELNLHPRAFGHFLDTLVAMGVLRRNGDRYSTTPESRTYLGSDQPTYLGGFLKMTVDFLTPAFDSLPETLRTGRAHGEDDNGEVPFGQIWRNPMALQFFLTGMDTMNGSIGPTLADVFDWSAYQTFVDLGGARGNLSASLAEAQPHLRGLVFDLPPVEPFFRQLMKGREVASRVSFQPGDFFNDPLPDGDVLIFGNVLHDWSEKQRGELVKKAFDAVHPGGALLVYDPMLDDDRRRLDNLLLSMYMLTSSPSGCEYTSGSCTEWLSEAGFTEVVSAQLPAKETVVIGRKPR